MADEEKAIPIDAVTHFLPVRNGIQYFPLILEDIAQNFRAGDEILIVDDKSTDTTYSFVQNYFSEFSDFVLLRGQGTGLVDALNLGLMSSKRNWIARYDVDDRYSPLRLQKQRDFFSSDVSVIFSDYQVRSNSSREIGTIPSGLDNTGCCLSLVFSQQTPHPSAVINRIKFEEAGGYKVDEFPAEDLGLWIRMSKLGKLISSPETLLYYRLSPLGISRTNHKMQIEKRDNLVSNFVLNSSFELSEIAQTAKTYLMFDNAYARRLLLVRNALRFDFMKYPKRFRLIERIRIGLLLRPTDFLGIFTLLSYARNKFLFKLFP